mmetsp:Transcript_46365/g.143067  ORF Transcript_46365/g.143067 Transcript_46365/m.143067 type:complete len:311 (-) Transcript_46365:13-945(-)
MSSASTVSGARRALVPKGFAAAALAGPLLVSAGVSPAFINTPLIPGDSWRLRATKLSGSHCAHFEMEARSTSGCSAGGSNWSTSPLMSYFNRARTTVPASRRAVATEQGSAVTRPSDSKSVMDEWVDSAARLRNASSELADTAPLNIIVGWDPMSTLFGLWWRCRRCDEDDDGDGRRWSDEPCELPLDSPALAASEPVDAVDFTLLLAEGLVLPPRRPPHSRSSSRPLRRCTSTHKCGRNGATAGSSAPSSGSTVCGALSWAYPRRGPPVSAEQQLPMPTRAKSAGLPCFRGWRPCACVLCEAQSASRSQ